MGFPDERRSREVVPHHYLKVFLFSEDEEDEDELMKMNRRDPKRLLGEKFDPRRNF